MKTTTIRITAEIEIPSDMLSELDYLAADSLVGEWVKVKSGEFENIASGNIIEAVVVKRRQYRGKTIDKG